MEVTVIGGGFVGVTTAVVLSEQGHGVSLVEVSERRAVLEAGLTVVDGRRHLDGRALADAGARYLAVGSGRKVLSMIEEPA